MRRVLHITLVIFAVILAYLSFAPIDIEPAAWQPQPPPSGETGSYARNDLLKGIERIAAGVGKGPEAIAFDAQGRVYTGFVDGRVARFEPDGSGYTLLANTGGRPLGVFIHPDGSVIVCDASRGLLKIGQDGKITVLAAEAEGIAVALHERSRGHEGRFQGLLYRRLVEIRLWPIDGRHHRTWRPWPVPGLRFQDREDRCPHEGPAVCQRRGARPRRSFRARE